jgi:hypothetical protein
VVDCTGLENRQPARVPGFESLSFRQKDAIPHPSDVKFGATPITSGKRTPGFSFISNPPASIPTLARAPD